MSIAMFINTLNGYSGMTSCVDFYFALFSIALSCIMIASFLNLDQGVSFNTKIYARDNYSQAQLNLQMSTVPGRLNLKSIGQSHKMNLKQKGVQFNTDGSTNNISQYFCFCREKYQSTLMGSYKFYYFWAFLSGFVIVNISLRCLSGIVNKNGETLDYFNIAFCCVASMITISYSQCMIEYKNHTQVTLLICSIQLALILIVINVNDKL